MKKVVKIVTLLAILVFILSVTVFAAQTDPATSGIDPSGFKGDSNYNTTSIKNMGNQIISIVSTIGSIASVIVLVVLGIKYMMGSAEEKAEYKKTLLPYIIGAALVFAASTIAGAIFSFTGSFGQ